ncbi:preprotein translocase subunit SecE [Candidatus Shapirobacteria bacterium]|nr:preprotein translocase subunit SecE [Candidatus Shapirobacteria bacterium]
MQKIINFFKEVRAEFKQISWPKRESLIQSTIVVISISIIVSLILGGFDYLFTQGIGFLGQSNKPVNTNQIQIPTPTLNPLPTISPTNIPKK